MDGHRELSFAVSPEIGEVSAILVRPKDARWLLVYGHGAGAGMRHAFMDATAGALARHGIATLRYMFPYTEAGRRRPDRPKLLLPTIEAAARAAVAAAADTGGPLPLIAGGKSMGGRMTSTLASEGGLDGVRGLVFFGFPLHAPGREGVERAAHLAEVRMPMLFLQGTRDKLAAPGLIREVTDGLGDRATLHVVDGADHGFHVLKRSGRTDDDVVEELAATTATWAVTL